MSEDDSTYSISNFLSSFILSLHYGLIREVDLLFLAGLLAQSVVHDELHGVASGVETRQEIEPADEEVVPRRLVSLFSKVEP